MHDRNAEPANGTRVARAPGDERHIEAPTRVSNLDRECVALELAAHVDKPEVFIPVLDGVRESFPRSEGDIGERGRREPAGAREIDHGGACETHGCRRAAKSPTIFAHSRRWYPERLHVKRSPTVRNRLFLADTVDRTVREKTLVANRATSQSGVGARFVDRYAPYAGAALTIGAIVLASKLLVAGIGLGAIGLALAGYALLRSAADERDRFEARRSELERHNSDLVQHNRVLESAKREADAVLSAVRAHLMIIDQSYFIQNRYSSELEGIFNQRELGHENFLNVLQRILSERMFKTARDYLALLFDISRKERVVLKVNPLDEVEVTAEGSEATAGLRYLNFDFRRIVEDGVVTRVLVSVEDISERTIRERQLRESEQQKVKQFELLIGILHVEPQALDNFVDLANDELAVVDEALKASDFAAATIGQTALLRQRLDVVLERIHNIKGNAAFLRLEYFEKIAQDFEQKIVDLKHRPALGGDDFLTVVIGLAAFRADLDDLQSLRVKLAGIHRGVQIREEVGDDLVTSVTELARDLAKKLGKDVRVDADGFDSRGLAPAHRMVVKDVLIQLTRNSLAHGVETPVEREAAKKARTATIEIHPLPNAPADTFGFTFRDDGRGLDALKIRERAIAAGLLARAEADAVDDSQIAGFIFAPGFSTADETTGIAGRGVGMNVVKTRVVDDCGGEIGVDSESGHFCEFSFVLPTNDRVALAAAR